MDSKENEKKAVVNETKDLMEKYPKLLEELKNCNLPEEKIKTSLNWMKEAISQDEAPRFKEFWDVRKFCLPFFKENLNPIMRSSLWNEFIELSSEARKLKEILDEQSSFEVEQIDLALKALEEDVLQLDTLISQAQEIPCPEGCSISQERWESYSQVQKELNLLTTLASRINGLRKEILKTNMRIKYKNQFFKRLSSMGDQVFPRRKEKVKEISSKFIEDISAFVATHFPEDRIIGAPFYVLREQIKAFQNLAKVFTLNTHTFMNSREKLSTCWDRVKKQEKDRKKEMNVKRQMTSENKELIAQKIENLKQECKKEERPLEKLQQEYQEILKSMRDVELARQDLKVFRGELNALKEFFHEKTSLVKKEDPRKKKQEEISLKIENFQKEMEQMDLSSLEKGIQQLQKEVQKLGLYPYEKDLFKIKLKALTEIFEEKKEKELLNRSDEEISSLEKLNTVLDERKKRRSQIKQQLEIYRKKVGGSGFDFETAMSYNEMISQEKERLEKADEAIEEIEGKIADLEGQ